MIYDPQAQRELNKQHSFDPQPGDFWQEMFAPVAVVIAVSDISVTTLERIKNVDRGRWTWDLEARPEFYTRTEFAYRWTCGPHRQPLYRGEATNSMSREHWCDVMPKHHAWILEHLPPALGEIQDKEGR